MTKLFPIQDTSTSRTDNFPFFFLFKRKFHIGMAFVYVIPKFNQIKNDSFVAKGNNSLNSDLFKYSTLSF